ncbi:MAG: Hsp33 family molecular chaperone [Rhodoblastus sp.]
MKGESRPVSDAAIDDVVLPFAVEALDLRGRLVRLGPGIDSIVQRHGYPAPVARLLCEAAALTVLLGSAMKQDGLFQLQARTEGAVDMIVVDFDTPDRLRAFARFDAARLAAAEAEGKTGGAELLGRGHLGLTVDPGGSGNRYQGVVALEGEGLERAAHHYFERSEQIPTVVRLAVGEIVTAAGAHWRAGGLIVQFLPESEDRRRQADLAPGDAPAGTLPPEPDEDEAWTEGRALAGTVEAHELIDPSLSGERLLFRLFHERGVRVFPPADVRDQCRCSTASIRTMLQRFTAQERADMVGEDGKIGVTCEFCSEKREFDPKEFD